MRALAVPIQIVGGQVKRDGQPFALRTSELRNLVALAAAGARRCQVDGGVTLRPDRLEPVRGPVRHGPRAGRHGRGVVRRAARRPTDAVLMHACRSACTTTGCWCTAPRGPTTGATVLLLVGADNVAQADALVRDLTQRVPGKLADLRSRAPTSRSSGSTPPTAQPGPPGRPAPDRPVPRWRPAARHPHRRARRGPTHQGRPRRRSLRCLPSVVTGHTAIRRPADGPLPLPTDPLTADARGRNTWREHHTARQRGPGRAREHDERCRGGNSDEKDPGRRMWRIRRRDVGLHDGSAPVRPRRGTASTRCPRAGSSCTSTSRPRPRAARRARQRPRPGRRVLRGGSAERQLRRDGPHGRPSADPARTAWSTSPPGRRATRRPSTHRSRRAPASTGRSAA